ncbi:ankyrin repeat-containing domain protein [Aspergillus floccosus]
MRLLDTTEPASAPFKVIEFTDDEIPPYAILSHTWNQEEITLRDLEIEAPNYENLFNKKGYTKVRRACALARQSGYDWLWMDTCCIDKTSSAELSEAINSMYRWYQQAGICYAWLSDAWSPSDVPTCRWFTRGWTLQELVAPSTVVFLDARWEVLGTKESLRSAISERTGIPESILSGDDDLESMSVAQRMSWAAGRRTTRVEDRAYCLLGLFSISIPLVYGEGQKAFYRLQEEIMRVSDDMTLFAWRSPIPSSGLLAPSADAFEGCTDVVVSESPFVTSHIPWTVGNKGIQLQLPFLPVGRNGLGWAILSASRRGKETCFLAVYLRDIHLTMELFERVWCDRVELIYLKRFQPAQFPMRQIRVQQRRSTNSSSTLSEPPDGGIDSEVFSWALMSAQGHTVDYYRAEDGDALDKVLRAAGRDDPGSWRDLRRHVDPKINKQDIQKRTLLWYAVSFGNAPAVWLLLAQKHVDVNSTDKLYQTALSKAVEHNHIDIVWLLLSRSDIDAFPIIRHGLTPFYQAARSGDETIIRMYLAQDRFRANIGDASGRTFLSHAAECGRAEVIQMLLKRVDMKVDAEDKERGWTPLTWAAALGKDDVCKVLLSHGADINHEDHEKKTPLRHAVDNDHATVCLTLIENGSALDIENHQCRRALFYAVHHRLRGLCQALLDRGVPVNLTDDQGMTPLMHAVADGNEVLCRLLLGHGADANFEDRAGKSPFWYASLKGHKEIEHLLHSHCARPCSTLM